MNDDEKMESGKWCSGKHTQYLDKDGKVVSEISWVEVST